MKEVYYLENNWCCWRVIIKILWIYSQVSNPSFFNWRRLQLLQLKTNSCALVSSQYKPNDQTGELIEQSNNQIPFRDFMRFRAIVDIDSNGASTRYGPLLCMNSVVIKVKPKFGNYWNDELEPWVHFIPVESDLSDLKKQIDFAVSNKHQKQVRQIIHNANSWCRTVSPYYWVGWRLAVIIWLHLTLWIILLPTTENDVGTTHTWLSLDTDGLCWAFRYGTKILRKME
jgi:hypothetical protein